MFCFRESEALPEYLFEFFGLSTRFDYDVTRALELFAEGATSRLTVATV